VRGNCLAFLDVPIIKVQTGLQATTHRKPTDSGLYTLIGQVLFLTTNQ